MTDHMDEAAAKAMDLAEWFVKDESTNVAEFVRRIPVAAHLTYMAGLLRGGGVKHEAPLNITGEFKASSSGERVTDPNMLIWRGPEPHAFENEIPHDHLPWPVRQAVSAVLHACYEHEDPKVREAREQLYNAVTHGQVTDPTLETDGDTADPREAARNFRLSAEKVGGHVNPHGDTWAAGVRHGYLMAADALDAFAGVYDQARAQRDDLLAAIRDASADNGRPPALRLQDVVNVARAVEERS